MWSKSCAPSPRRKSILATAVCAPCPPGVVDQLNPSSVGLPVSAIWDSRFNKADHEWDVNATLESGICGMHLIVSSLNAGWGVKWLHNVERLSGSVNQRGERDECVLKGEGGKERMNQV